MIMKRATRNGLVSVLLFLATSLGVLADEAGAKPESAPFPHAVSVAELDKAIRLAAGYLSQVTLPNGEFIYLANPDPRFKSPVEYHVVRHAAVMYVFSLYLQHYDDPVAAEAWAKASGFLNQCCITTVPGQVDQLAVWSLPQLHQTDTPLEADLGGTGLALVGMTGLEARTPGSVDIEGLRALGRFLLSMQDKDGRFIAKFTPGRGGAREAAHSLYYPGEAVLGLLALYELDPSPQWLQAAIKAVVWLFENQSVDDQPADHWTLLAAARLMAVTGGRGLPFDRDYLAKHVARLSEALLADYQPPADPALRGAVHKKGYTTPTSTRLEGLLASVDLLPAHERALRERIRAFAQDGVGFLVRVQIQDGPFAGGIPAAIGRQATEGVSAKPSRRASEVRIDYVQHALGAMLAYRQRMPSTKKAR